MRGSTRKRERCSLRPTRRRATASFTLSIEDCADLQFPGMRLFVAIPLALPVIKELSALTTRLQSYADGIRWASPESWHITLQFLGNTSQQQYECVVDRLRGLNPRPVAVQLEEPGFFDRAGIFFIGVRPVPALLLLQRQIAAATDSCGFIPENRPYRPHITLVRREGKSGGEGFRKLQARLYRPPRFTSFVAEEFVLYESITRAAGSQYVIRQRFPIASQ
jgi:2'-5' RNA ligase